MRLLAMAGLTVAILVCVGCGASNDGPPRYALSGSAVLADGKPIPVGEIVFEPDAAAGNKGPGSTAPIKDGQYSLSMEEGVVGGKYIATLIAYDGVAFGESVQGKALLNEPYVEKLDLPTQDSTHDFHVGKK